MRTGLRALALAGGVALGLALAEAGARLLEPGGPLDGLASDIGERVDDPVLDYRTLADTGQNDAAGYRNPRALERADVVALGDSQTWGVNAEMDETWPARLAELTGLRVYNMGRGGYGIVQYRHQLEEALELQPEWVVVALYLGNDVYDAWSLVYARDAHAALRHPDPRLRERIASSQLPDLQRMFFDRVRYGREQDAAGWLARHSALVRMIDRARARPADVGADRAWARDHPEDGFVYDDGRMSTVFHPSYRLVAVDSRLPKIREGLRISLRVLEDMQARMQAAAGSRLLVLLLPTKERVFARAIEAAGVRVPDSYPRSVGEEARIAAGLSERMERLGIAYLDLLPALEDSVARNEAIFPPNVDGHFTPLGYERVAREVAAAIDAAGADGSP